MEHGTPNNATANNTTEPNLPATVAVHPATANGADVLSGRDMATTVGSSASNEFYNLVQGENFKQFLSINRTTEDRQNAIAQHYGALDKLTASKHEGDHVDTYFKLYLLVKTKSKNDKVWISFIEGLHRCTAILASLMRMKFDYSNNIIIPGSLQIDNFEKAQILHYKNPSITPRQQFALIVGNNFKNTYAHSSKYSKESCKTKWRYHTAIDESFENKE